MTDRGASAGPRNGTTSKGKTATAGPGRPSSATVPPARVVPAWLPIVTMALAVIGICIASYLTYEHYTASTSLSCPESATFNCLKVTTSSYSKLFGIPVALLGLMYFVVALPLCTPFAWRSRYPAVHALRLGGSIVGVLFVCYLVWAELFRINSICLWCSGVHITTLLLFFVICFGSAIQTTAEPDPT